MQEPKLNEKELTEEDLEKAMSNVIEPLTLKYSEYTATAHKLGDLMMRCIIPKDINGSNHNSSHQKYVENLSAWKLYEHDDILKYYGGSIQKIGQPFSFFMEYFDENLFDCLRDPKRDFTTLQILQFVKPILSAIAFCAENQQYPILTINEIVICNGLPKILNESIAYFIIFCRENMDVEPELEFLLLRMRAKPPEAFKPSYKPNIASTLYSLGLLLLDMFYPNELREQLTNLNNKTMTKVIHERIQAKHLPIPESCPEPLKNFLLDLLNPESTLRPSLEIASAFFRTEEIRMEEIVKDMKKDHTSLVSKISSEILVNELLNRYILFAPKKVKPSSDTDETLSVTKSNESMPPPVNR